jgi:hypothetical protein
MDTITCPECGTVNAASATTCMQCGTNLKIALESPDTLEAGSEEALDAQAPEEYSGPDRCTIIVSRPSRFLGAPRNYGIFVDNQKMGVIGNGETTEIHVPPGDHVIHWEQPQLGSPALSTLTEKLLPTIPAITSEDLPIHLDLGASIRLSCQVQSGLWHVRGYLEIIEDESAA